MFDTACLVYHGSLDWNLDLIFFFHYLFPPLSYVGYGHMLAVRLCVKHNKLPKEILGFPDVVLTLHLVLL